MNIEICKTLKKLFYDYVSSFNEASGKLEASLEDKLHHIERVAADSAYIASGSNWTEDETAFAEICGLYHDIGRFSQLRDYGTLDDSKSVNHGLQGFKILIKHNMCQGLDPDDAVVLLDCVRFHNAFEIPCQIPDTSKKYLETVRDADKLDILRMAALGFSLGNREKIKEILWGAENSGASENVINKLVRGEKLYYSDVKKGTDVCLLYMSWIYDLRSLATLKKIKDEKILTKISAVLPEGVEYEAIKKSVSEYIKSSLMSLE